MLKQEENLTELEKSFAEELKAAEIKAKATSTRKQVVEIFQELEQKYLNKNSGLTEILKTLKEIAEIDQRKKVGERANKLRIGMETQLVEAQAKVADEISKKQLQNEEIDPTRPGIEPQQESHQHIISKTVQEIEDIFISMGFGIAYPYEVDNAYNTFDTLNIPASHPARDNWDTLWLSDGNLMIPHTSAMQNRILRAEEAPIRKVVIGKTFRNEATDARHEHTFTQVEGIYLNKRSSMAEMLGVLLEFFQAYFNRKLKYKFTPDFFPFVEPGGQMAIECVICNGTGQNCRVCKGSGFLEVLGCGMIHPSVIREAGKDPAQYAGFAWGFGVERIAMIKYQINDLRAFYSGDLRFVKQFD